MPTLDVFKTDPAFSVTSLTDAILKAKYLPARLGQLGLFRSKGIPTTSIMVEEKDGQLTLIANTPRGGPGSHIGESKRTARQFKLAHLQRESTINADEVQDVRAFGSEQATSNAQDLVNERLAILRQMHEATHEHLRIGALKGIIYDSDGSTPIYNLFTEFGVSQQTAELDVTATGKTRSGVVAAKRLIETELGDTSGITGYRAICGYSFFDDFIEGADVVKSLQYQEGQVLREDLRTGFSFGGVTWEEYRGSVGGVSFIDADKAYLFPEGADIFRMFFGPADFIEANNTVGLPIYAKQAADAEFNRWVKVHTQSNPLALCLRPRAVVEVTLNS